MPAAPWTQPPPLPSPPMLEVWLFERPVAAAGAIIGAAALCFLVLRARGSGRAARVVPGSMVLEAALVAAAGVLVETSRERVGRLSGELIAAFERADEGALAALLADDLALDLGASEGGATSMGASGGKALVLQAAASFRGEATIEASRVRRPVAIDGPRSARAQIFVRTGGAGVGPSISWWMCSWRRDADGRWRITLIELLLLNGERPRDLAPELRRRIS